MAEIRIDQSHCNHHLALHLVEHGWNILFTDAGRVSRGGGGSQGKVLSVFEAGGLPIPDIVAVSGATAQIVEVDSSPRLAGPSFQKYLMEEGRILRSLSGIIGGPLSELELAFCWTGTIERNVKHADAWFGDLPFVSKWYSFPYPRTVRTFTTPLLFEE